MMGFFSIIVILNMLVAIASTAGEGVLAQFGII